MFMTSSGAPVERSRTRSARAVRVPEDVAVHPRLGPVTNLVAALRQRDVGLDVQEVQQPAVLEDRELLAQPVARRDAGPEHAECPLRRPQPLRPARRGPRSSSESRHRRCEGPAPPASTDTPAPHHREYIHPGASSPSIASPCSLCGVSDPSTCSVCWRYQSASWASPRAAAPMWASMCSMSSSVIRWVMS